MLSRNDEPQADDEAIRRLEARIASAEQRAETAERRLASARQSRVDAETRMSGAESEVEALQDELQRLAAAHRAVLGSSSWRLTAPVRGLGARLPGTLRRRLRQLVKLVWWTATLQIASRAQEWRQLRRQRGAGPGPLPVAATPAVAEIAAAPRGRGATVAFYEPPNDLLPWFNPLNVEVSPALASRPMLNVLIPSTAKKHLSGGPNTALNIVYRLAAKGVAIRLISTDAPPDADPAPFWNHIRALADANEDRFDFELADASDRKRTLLIGVNDVFMATAWWTAQMAKYASRRTRHSRFIYLIQDYEPLLHPSSTQSALADETYGLDCLPVINSHLLHEFLVRQGIGRFADPAFAEAALVFEPAVAPDLFFPTDAARAAGARRRLLFYARPTIGRRNTFELGLAALQKLVAEGHFDPDAWDFVAIGEPKATYDLGRGAVLEGAPWLDLAGYAELMRTSDVLLSPMLSPHPSYPPLEMAACGRPVVTTVYGNKTTERLAAISPNIIGTPATIEGIAAGLLKAVRFSSRAAQAAAGELGLPATWSESLADVVPRLHAALLEQIGAPPLAPDAAVGPGDETGHLFPGYRRWPVDHYNTLRFDLLRDRDDFYPEPEPGLVSLLTPLWNTDPVFVTELAESVFGQDLGPGAEWIILDNGTTRADTRALLEQLATRADVTLLRVEENVGIIRGIRLCLEAARNRYIVPLDSDDVLTPDCLRIVTSALWRAGYPALAYTDEDKKLGTLFREPYCKPDWDPVLFVHSCYIAHLCAIDRVLALQLGAYTDNDVQGSHDWDTFMRFHFAGHEPLHIAELVYTWRMHERSTSGNMDSKDYIFSSQRNVLQKFVARLPAPDRYRLELSPLFSKSPDWRIVREADAAPVVPTIMLGATEAAARDLAGLLRLVEGHEAPGGFIHLLSADAKIEDPTWHSDAMALFEAFPDTVVVGGRIHRDGAIVAADGYFGFGHGCESPNVGRALGDPGYFAQMWKPHSADAVPIEHCVVRADFLASTLRRLVGAGASLAGLAGWLGIAARAREARVIYSPFLSASVTRDPAQATRAEQAAIGIAASGFRPVTRLLSERLGRTRESAYLPLRPQEAGQATAAQALDYPDRQAAELMARLVTTDVPAAHCRLSLLTTLYSRSPGRLFRETAASVMAQTVRDFEWIILAKGQVSDEIRTIMAELEADPRVRCHTADDIGIIDGMRTCLERATGDFVVPVDGDDVLTVDALQQLCAAIAAPDGPSFVFSDEDMLGDTGLCEPNRRARFDPILNAEDSYVWHLCAFRRERALELGVYTDGRAEFCHDWDTVTRFARAGETIGHAPAVIYHWRVHTASSSNSGVVNTGSLNSVKHMLEQTIARQAKPHLYDIGPCPVHRGFEQFAIRRVRREPLPVCLLLLVPPGAEARDPRDGPIGELLTVTTPMCDDDMAASVEGVRSDFILMFDARDSLRDDAGVWEAMRMFEMYPDIGAVSGRVLDQDGMVIDCCLSETGSIAGHLGWIGMRRTDPGPFARALKPQTAVSLPANFFFCRKDVLRQAFERTGGATIGDRVAAACRSRGLRLGYSPAIEAWRDPGHDRSARLDRPHLPV
jgi:glycosyltransferase involved in cell wall biosynthesis